MLTTVPLTYLHMLTSYLHAYAHLLRTCVRLPLTYLHTSMLASYLQSYICLPSYLHAYAHESLTYTRGVAMLESERERGSPLLSMRAKCEIVRAKLESQRATRERATVYA